MPREGITREQVFGACAELVGRGQKPTTRSVRAALGNTGSPNNIAAWVKEWREQQPEVGTAAPAAPLEIPELVRQAMEEATARIWRTAQELIQAEVQAAKQACEQQVALAQQERDDAAGTAEDLNEQIEVAEQKRAELEALAEGRTRELETLRRENAALSERAGLFERQLAFERERGERLEARLAELVQALQKPASGGKSPAAPSSKKERDQGAKAPKRGSSGGPEGASS